MSTLAELNHTKQINIAELDEQLATEIAKDAQLVDAATAKINKVRADSEAKKQLRDKISVLQIATAELTALDNELAKVQSDISQKQAQGNLLINQKAQNDAQLATLAARLGLPASPNQEIILANTQTAVQPVNSPVPVATPTTPSILNLAIPVAATFSADGGSNGITYNLASEDEDDDSEDYDDDDDSDEDYYDDEEEEGEAYTNLVANQTQTYNTSTVAFGGLSATSAQQQSQAQPKAHSLPTTTVSFDNPAVASQPYPALNNQPQQPTANATFSAMPTYFMPVQEQAVMGHTQQQAQYSANSAAPNQYNTALATLSNGGGGIVEAQLGEAAQAQHPPATNTNSNKATKPKTTAGAGMSKPKIALVVVLVIAALILAGSFVTANFGNHSQSPTSTATNATRTNTPNQTAQALATMSADTKPGEFDDAGVSEPTPSTANDNLVDVVVTPTADANALTATANALADANNTTATVADTDTTNTTSGPDSTALGGGAVVSGTAQSGNISNTNTTIAATATQPPAPTATPVPQTYPVEVKLAKLNIDTKVQQAKTQPDEDGSKNPDGTPVLQWAIPDFAAAHHTNSADCGQQGVAILAGHNWWAMKHGVFYSLHLAQPGDVITCSSSNGQTYKYQVVNLSVHGPTDISWYNTPKDDSTTWGIAGHYLILYTCTSDFVNRIVVLAKQVS